MKIPPGNDNHSQIPELLLAVAELYYLLFSCYTTGHLQIAGQTFALSQHSCSEYSQINSIQSIDQSLVKLGNSGVWAWVCFSFFAF